MNVSYFISETESNFQNYFLHINKYGIEINGNLFLLI